MNSHAEASRTLVAGREAAWVIVSTGMFTSFLFEPGFDVVNLEPGSVHGLTNWDAQVTGTTPADVGKLTTAILLAKPRIADQLIYVEYPVDGSPISSRRSLAAHLRRRSGRSVNSKPISPPLQATSWHATARPSRFAMTCGGTSRPCLMRAKVSRPSALSDFCAPYSTDFRRHRRL